MTTLPKLSDLSPEEKRAMIATGCGVRVFTFCGEEAPHDPVEQELPAQFRGYDRYFKCRKCDGAKWGSHRLWHENEDARREYPDYCNDLNAMHRVEETLSIDEQGRYCTALIDIMKLESLDENGSHKVPLIQTWHWHATARMRADAFLLAKGLAGL